MTGVAKSWFSAAACNMYEPGLDGFRTPVKTNVAVAGPIDMQVTPRLGIENVTVLPFTSTFGTARRPIRTPNVFSSCMRTGKRTVTAPDGCPHVIS